MRNQNCPVCSVPMTAVQVIGDGEDDVVFFKCPKCSKEIFVGYFTIRPPVIGSKPKNQTVGFGDAPESAQRGGIW